MNERFLTSNGSTCVQPTTTTAHRWIRSRAKLLVFVLGIITVVSSVLHSQSAAQNAGLLAAYSFEGATESTITDISGNNNTGPLVNGPSSSLGKYGNGLMF